MNSDPPSICSSAESPEPVLLPPSPSLKKLKECKVCGLPAHGIHFGALTCRACAAFFRRAAAGANFVIKCRGGKKNCELTSNGRSCCKLCRLNKCKDIGMEMDNFQFDRDRIGNSRKIAPSMACFLGRPHFMIQCSPITEASTSTTSSLIDFSNVLEKASIRLSHPRTAPYAPGRNRLQKLSSVLDIETIRNSNDHSNLKMLTKFGFEEIFAMWEHDLMISARWLAEFEEFCKLDDHLKMKFLKCTWYVWNRLEKLARTTAFIRKRERYTQDNFHTVFVTDNNFIDLRKWNLDISFLTSYSLEQVAYYIEGVGDFSSFTLFQPMIDLDPSDVELSYMLAYVSFQHAAKLYPDDFQEISDKSQQIIADDLHEYYAKEMRRQNYADRIAKILKMKNIFMKVFRQRQEKVEIARTFDIFNVNCSDPDILRELY